MHRKIAALRRGSLERARRLVGILAWLRLFAVGGQALTVLVVASVLRLDLPLAPLATGMAVLALFNVFACWRLTKPWPVTLAEAFGHVAVDLAGLAWLLFWTGGANNPFTPLLVIPIALAAAALPARYVVVVALLAAGLYALLIPVHVPLPPLHGDSDMRISLHILGSAISFVVTAVLLSVFISRLARGLRDREIDVRRERERALRDEGILAIASQAAGTAHELNTPLSTIQTLVGELQREHADDPELAEDLALLAGQAHRCRDILRELVAVGRGQLAGTRKTLALDALIKDVTNQFALLRPEVRLEVVRRVEGRLEFDADPNLRHAIINLMCNAADASLAAGRPEVALEVAADGTMLALDVRDHGAGIPAGGGTAFQTSKQHGLGLGLALANATAERLGGSLLAVPVPGGGLVQQLRIPLSPIEERTR